MNELHNKMMEHTLQDDVVHHELDNGKVYQELLNNVVRWIIECTNIKVIYYEIHFSMFH